MFPTGENVRGVKNIEADQKPTYKFLRAVKLVGM